MIKIISKLFYLLLLLISLDASAKSLISIKDSISVGEYPKYKSKFVYEVSLGSYRKAFPENNSAWVTSVESEQQRYIKDPLCGFPLTVSSYKSMGKLIDKINRKEWYENVPRKMGLMLISGENDPVGDMGKGINKIYKKLVYSCHRVKMIIYPELRHALINEKNSDKVFEDILFFINNETVRCSAPKTNK